MKIYTKYGNTYITDENKVDYEYHEFGSEGRTYFCVSLCPIDDWEPLEIDRDSDELIYSFVEGDVKVNHAPSDTEDYLRKRGDLDNEHVIEFLRNNIPDSDAKTIFKAVIQHVYLPAAGQNELRDHPYILAKACDNGTCYLVTEDVRTLCSLLLIMTYCDGFYCHVPHKMVSEKESL